MEQQTWTAFVQVIQKRCLHTSIVEDFLILILTRVLVIPGKESEFAKSRQQRRATGKDGFLNEIVTK